MILFPSVIVLASSLLAGSITVTKPQDGDFLGRSNTVGFNIDGASREVRVRVQAFRVLSGGNEQIAVTVVERFTPNSNGQINGNINLNFAQGTPEGQYRIRVTATETGNTYNTPDPIDVTVDVKDPSFRTLNPINNAFVKGNASGIIRITASLLEANVEEWRVKINGGDIPGNSGSSESVSVNWDTDGITNDGNQAIDITVDDLAGNSASRGLTVTLDRVKPSSTILTPTNNFQLRAGTHLPVGIEIADQFANSVGLTGIDVVARRLNGTFITRVARRSANSSGNNLSWVGRLRWRDSLPNDFKIVVTAIDKAGNRAVVQEVRVKVVR
ncbi:MAG: hypothetical protein IT207_11200 [Fimbriimonadaceae bacterium]|nr:hypothetical protein [Fimbriimonadaceae bacterium]